MPLCLAKTQAVADLAEHLADFLPGTPHPYADQGISLAWVGAAQPGRLLDRWKQDAAVTRLLELTIKRRPRDFCMLVLEVARRGIAYRQRNSPVTKANVRRLDQLLIRCGFRIKDLADPVFLKALPDARRPLRVPRARRAAHRRCLARAAR